MPRSKSIHFVQKQFTVTVPNDAQLNILDGTIDLAAELSNQLGHEIRQGNTFRVVGMQATIRGYDAGGDLDTGASVVVGAEYLPTTSHSRKAWNNVFQQWSKQKRLAGAVGQHIRFDDMEFAWNSNHIVPLRTSTIYQDLADGSPESLVLTGDSTVGTDFSLEDYYNSAYQNQVSSRDHFTNTVFKAPKAGAYLYPPIQTIYTSATHSAMVDGSETPDNLGGAISMNDFQFFPADNHLNVFCGVMRFFGKLMPVDTEGQIADDLLVTVTIAVEGWTPLVYKRKKMKPYARKRLARRGRKYGRKY